MKLIIDIKYNGVEFTPEDIEAIKIFITNQLKDSDRQNGIGLMFKKSMFMITSIYYDIEQNAKVISLKQLTTQKSLIQQPKLVV